MFQNVIIGWVFRRALEVGGIGVAIYQIYLTLPPYVQAAITRVLTGDASPEQIAIAVGGLGVAAFGYVWSFRSTVRPQVVTADKQQIPIKPDSVAQSKVEVIAKSATPPKTLWERITNRT